MLFEEIHITNPDFSEEALRYIVMSELSNYSIFGTLPNTNSKTKLVFEKTYNTDSLTVPPGVIWIENAFIGEPVYTAQFNFQPVMGETYHLYMREDESVFLSLIPPNAWKQKYIASFELDSREKWVKINFDYEL